ncbi:MAG: hypothetical protein LBV73_17295 [Paraburkholderia sp.]|jgi:2-dehydro-3-deoxyglucarate aldolase/4-hydroxy-2-oxoheptanedioate aldolase|nr:hypothetical protein [Paraburkholderia sp.]
MTLFASFRPALAGSAPVDLAWLALGSPAIAEYAARVRPGGIVLDLQHGLWERGTLEAALGAIGRQVPVIARCADHSAHQIGAALDAGAAAVLVPLIESADDARRAVAASHYPPLGVRSAGGVRMLAGGVEAMVECGRQVVVGALIETVKGVENVEAIAAVPGLDFLFIGTGDLSLSRGTADAELIGRDCARVLRAAQAHGLPCGLFTNDAEAASRAFADGYRLAVAANDIGLVAQGLRDARARALRLQPGDGA